MDRNLLKRRLRDIGRRAILPELARRDLVVDVLVRTRREAYGATYETLATEVREAVEALCSEES